MPGYVHAEKIDIFISYSHVDDQIFDGEEAGWVTRLVRNVEKLLAMRLGRREFFDLWMDGRLTGNEPVNDLIEGKIHDTAAFLLVLSPGYLGSIWCALELATFRAEVARRMGEESRVFVVEFGEIARPAELSQPRGYRFWQKDSLTSDLTQLGFPKLLPEHEPAYYRLVTELASDLERELRRQKAQVQSPAPLSPTPTPTPALSLLVSPSTPIVTEPPPSAAATIYLADVPEDIEDMRDGVKSYLQQAGYEILPRALYPEATDAYTAAVDGDLARSLLFVQLLSELPGRKIGEDGPRKAAFLLDRAARRNPPLPILQWRSRDLDWRRVTNEAHRKVLKGEAVNGRDLEVMEVDIEEFKAAVKARVDKLAAPPPPPSARAPDRDYFLFINADTADDGLSAELVRLIDESWSWIGYFPPRRDGDPEQVRSYLEQNLKDCDGLMVIFGAAGPDWVTAQLQKARQIAAVRDRGVLRVAVCEGPPEDNKNKPIGKLPRMIRIDCRHGLDRAGLGRFIESLREA
jgi:TIR domain